MDLETLDLASLPSVRLKDCRLLPETRCIYFVLSRKGKPLYIGQTCNLKMRWGSHKCKRLLADNRNIKIAWWVLENAKMRDCAETCLINIYSPALNYHRNGGGTFTKQYWQKLVKRAERREAAKANGK